MSAFRKKFWSIHYKKCLNELLPKQCCISISKFGSLKHKRWFSHTSICGSAGSSRWLCFQLWFGFMSTVGVFILGPKWKGQLYLQHSLLMGDYGSTRAKPKCTAHLKPLPVMSTDIPLAIENHMVKLSIDESGNKLHPHQKWK